MSWLFNLFMDGCMREMKAYVGNVGERLKMNGIGWAMVTCLFADETVLFFPSYPLMILLPYFPSQQRSLFFKFTFFFFTR